MERTGTPNGTCRPRSFWRLLRQHAVLGISAVLTLATMVLVPPDGEYLAYVDWNTLGCLFSVLAVANAFRLMGVFDRAAQRVIERLTAPRPVVAALVGTTAILSMMATNDMALVVMLPLAAATLAKAGWGRLIAKTFVLQGLAANLCGMILPFGNPQNLYLYSFYSLNLPEFLATMALPFVVSVILLMLAGCLLFRGERVGTAAMAPVPPTAWEPGRIVVYPLLLVLALLAVFRVVPVIVSAAVIVGVLVYADPRALRSVDYPLLLTFLCFFVFSGNMARLPILDEWLSAALAGSELPLSVGLSQLISNVPAAVLLSHFTDGWQGLLVGVNIGGAGTLVGSLANLIVLQQFTGLKRALPHLDREGDLSVGRFLGWFTLLNFAFLAVLLTFCLLGM